MEVLPQQRGELTVEVVERDDAVEDARPGQEHHGLQALERVPVLVVVVHVEDLVDALDRPPGLVLDALRGDEHDLPAAPLCAPEKVVPLFDARNHEDRF